MLFKILVMLSLLLFQNIFAAERELLVENTRFYSANTVDIDQDGIVEVVAAGQLNHGNEKNHSAYIAVFKRENSSFKKVSELSFYISHEGANMSTRIRNIQIIPEKSTGSLFFVTSGRAGEDEGGIGFIQYGKLHRDHISMDGYQKFVYTRAKYTHGYPLAIGDLNGDRKPEIVYGGFVGTEKGDRADIHVFRFEKGKLKEDKIAFSSLKIPLRVNAIVIGDLDGDNKNDIVIAGRTLKPNGKEYASFAWDSQGKTYHHIFNDGFPSRLRTLLIIDIDQDGKNELVTGGRQEFGKIWVADLQIWNINDNDANLSDRFLWSSGHQIRLRAISPIKNQPNHFRVAGRVEYRRKDGSVGWSGFIRSFGKENGFFQPVSGLELFDFGHETRIRDLHLAESGDTVLAGFGKTKAGENFGFIRFITANK
jgi:hypothetical protein